MSDSEDDLSTLFRASRTREVDREEQLEQLVIGKDSHFEKALDDNLKKRLFSDDNESEEADNAAAKKDSAWNDPDDDDLVAVGQRKHYKRFRTAEEKAIKASEMAQRLRDEYEKNLPTPAWATKMERISEKLPKVSDEDDNLIDSLATRTGSFVSKQEHILSVKDFQFKKLTNLNFDAPVKGIVHSVQFHPTAQIGMVASFGRTVNLFQVNGKANPKIRSVHFEKFPVSCAQFLDEGKEFLVCSPIHNFMFYFDLPSEKSVKIPWNKAIQDAGFQSFVVSPDYKTIAIQGKGGNIYLYSGQSKEWTATLKMSGFISGLAFSQDSRSLFSIGELGKVFIWDIQSRKCRTTFTDEGCVRGTTVAVSPNNEWVAVGSNTGVVNLYDKKDCEIKSAPAPVKTIMNLTTSATQLKFNSTSEILAIGSNQMHGAVKLFCLSEKQVVPNFPELNNRIRQPESFDFSLNSGFFSVGNNKGEALLYRLQHYKNY